MIHAGHALVLSALAIASALPASAQSGRSSPPVLSTGASPPTGARSEPAQMSGYALQVGDLPPGIVAIRLIRESFRTNVPNRTIFLRVGDSNRVVSATTNAEGRVQFDGLQVGDSVRVRADVGQEVLESQRFEIPSQGGVRMVLVAGVGADVASPSDPWPPATATSSSVPTTPPPTPMAPPRVTTPLTAAPDPARETTDVSLVGLATALGLLCVVAGVLVSRRRSSPGATVGTASVTPRAKRDAVFEELIRLEKSNRAGRAEGEVYAKRRDALIDELVALDSSLSEPGR